MHPELVGLAASNLRSTCKYMRVSCWQRAEVGLLPYDILMLRAEQLCADDLLTERQRWERVACDAIALAVRASAEGYPRRPLEVLEAAMPLAAAEEPVERNGSFQHARGALLGRIEQTAGELTATKPRFAGRELTPRRYDFALAIASLAIAGAALTLG